MEEEKKLIIVEDSKKITSVQKIIIYFFIYSFIGWLMEVVFAMFVERQFVNRGFLFGPICPIYGYGAILLIISLRKMKNNKISKFFVSAISFSIFEYIVSFLLELFFNQRWWDYSNDILNIKGRVSIIYSIVWGMLAILFIDKLHPWVKKKLDKIINKIGKKIRIIILILMINIYVIDTVMSIYIHLQI